MKKIEQCRICDSTKICLGKEKKRGNIQRYSPNSRENILILKSIYSCEVFQQRMITKDFDKTLVND